LEFACDSTAILEPKHSRSDAFEMHSRRALSGV
jgi:hypothetical protein